MNHAQPLLSRVWRVNEGPLKNALSARHKRQKWGSTDNLNNNLRPSIACRAVKGYRHVDGHSGYFAKRPSLESKRLRPTGEAAVSFPPVVNVVTINRVTTVIMALAGTGPRFTFARMTKSPPPVARRFRAGMQQEVPWCWIDRPRRKIHYLAFIRICRFSPRRDPLDAGANDTRRF